MADQVQQEGVELVRPYGFLILECSFLLMIGAGTVIRRREQDPEAHEEIMEW